MSIFKQIEATAGKNDKIAIVKQHGDNEEFKHYLRFLYDETITTGLSAKKMNKKIKINGVETVRGFDSVTDVMDFLKEHNTGTDKIILAVQNFLNGYDEEEREFLKQIFTKSYKCGITATSVNKALGKDFIHEFKVMLAFPYEKYADKVTGNFVISKKLDGHRTLCKIDSEGNIVFRTRKGHQITGMHDLEESVRAFFPVKKGRAVVLDGEIVISDKNVPNENVFQETSKIIRKDGLKTGLTFHIFDTVSHEDFVSGESTLLYDERRMALEHIFEHSSYKPEHIELVKSMYHGDDKSMIAKCMNIARENGWEGVMVNISNAPYVTKRTSGLLKVKEFFSADIEVVGAEVGAGKYSDTLGALVLDFDGHEVRLGTGFSDKERDEIWRNKEGIIGKIVQVDYFEITNNQQGGKSLRFPSYKGLRVEKTVDDINIE